MTLPINFNGLDTGVHGPVRLGILTTLTVDGPLDFTTLEPGDESPFVVTIPNVASVGRYQVSFRTESGLLRHVDRRSDQVRLATARRPEE